MPFNQKECLSSEGRDMSPKPGCVLIFLSVWDMCQKIEGRLWNFASSRIASGARQPFSSTLAMYFTDGLRSEEMGFSRVFIEYFLRIQCQFIYERMFCLINIYHVRELGCGMGSVLKEILQKVSLRRCFGKPSLRFLDQTRCWISF